MGWAPPLTYEVGELSSVSWCMERRGEIEIKRGCDLRLSQTVLNLRKYWVALKLTWQEPGGGQGGQPASVNINIPDKYSCPGVQIVVTKWGSWVDVLFMMVMIIMLHKKEISISHYLPPRTTSLCISFLSLPHPQSLAEISPVLTVIQFGKIISNPPVWCQVLLPNSHEVTAGRGKD